MFKELKRFLIILYKKFSFSERKKERRLTNEIIYYFDEKKDFWGKMQDEYVEWENLFIKIVKQMKEYNLNHKINLWEGFSKERLELIKLADTNSDYSAPIVICAIKNNYIYMREFIPYYRKLGVKHFILIDNDSNDNSLEYLHKQSDVTIFRAKYKFNGSKKAGWKLQALAYFGLNHWYLWLDSDEFLAYPHMENVSLNEYVSILDKKGIKNVGGFMLDMYPEYTLMDSNAKDENFYNDYVFFDGFSNHYLYKHDHLYGGMRGRALGIYDLRLDKTPLIYCTSTNIPMGNHDTFPKRKKLKENYGCVLKHYKFLPTDAEVYRKRLLDIDSGYSNRVAQMKYSEAIGLKVHTNESVRYTDSTVLVNFPCIKDFMENEVGNGK